jgi:3-deoxy-D-manno-octulosonic-acid transferase
MNRYLYSFLWHLALPLVGLRLLWRARKQPEYLHHLGERLGASPRAGSQPRLWVHAVSVGETRAAQPLIKALLAQYPEHEILLTHMTPTGRATSLELFSKEPRVLCCYLPYDLPWAQHRFLSRSRPLIGVVMETEVWPNLLQAARRSNIPVLLINARLSERSARGYQRLGTFGQQAFSDFTRVLAQTAADAGRLAACGARSPEICGNVKFDVELAPKLLALGDEFRAAAKSRPIILAASTREGEEEDLLAAFTRHAAPETLLVLVPRHPQRFSEVAGLVEKAGLGLQRRSEKLDIAPDTRVWLGDSMGEMVAYYRMCDVAIIGGSWQPLGGQNLIEACAAGKPVLVGPHTFNFTEAANKAIEAGAAQRCDNLDAALATSMRWLADSATRQNMGEAGLQFTAANRGAVRHILSAVSAIVPAGEAVRDL